MMLIAFLFVYPIINIIFWILGFLFGESFYQLPQLVRTLILAFLLVPIFGIGIPTLQKKFYKWTIK